VDGIDTWGVRSNVCGDPRTEMDTMELFGFFTSRLYETQEITRSDTTPA
jgi:hypothetical protein